MKVLLSVTAILFALLVMPACKKGSNSTVGNYYFKATVGTRSFSAIGLSKAYETFSSSGGLNYTYITGKADDGQAIIITFVNNTGVPLSISTVPLNTGSATADYYIKLDSTYTKANSGSVVITTLTPYIQGTFSFTCADSTQVTNGSFSVLAL